MQSINGQWVNFSVEQTVSSINMSTLSNCLILTWTIKSSNQHSGESIKNILKILPGTLKQQSCHHL